jgi:hypothetical protein
MLLVAEKNLNNMTHICIFLAGHAFEARIYAENVPKGFLPATGVLNHYRPVAVSPSGEVQNCVYNCFFLSYRKFFFLSYISDPVFVLLFTSLMLEFV